MKNISFLWIFLLFLVYSASCQNYQNINDFEYEENIDGTELYISIIRYIGNSRNVIIPEKINNAPVTIIGYKAFYGYKDIISIRLPDTIKYIGNDAFANCESLRTINIPESVVEIDYDAFYGCISLEIINIPANVEKIEGIPFDYCLNLKDINVDRNNNFFNSINGILFDKEGKTIIRYPPARSGIYNIPNGIITIGVGAFSDCQSISEINIPNTVRRIEGSAFAYCYNIENINIPENVEYISPYAFNYCKKLKSITVANYNRHYKSINGVLYDNTLNTLVRFPPNFINEEYIIPEGTINIGNSAFFSCLSLKSLIIPASLERIGYSRDRIGSISVQNAGAFEGCLNIQQIIVSNENIIFTSRDGVLFSKNMEKLIYYPTGRKGEYIIPNTVIEISFRAFADCSGLNNIVFSNSVQTIIGNAFQNCTGLIRLELPINVNWIIGGAFAYCKNITNIIIMNNEARIGEGAFYGCDSISQENKRNLIQIFGENIFR